MKENMKSFIALNGSCFFSGPVCPQTRSSLTGTTQTGFFWCEKVRYHRVRLFSFSPTNISHLILIFLLQLNWDLRLFVLPHESAEQLSDSKQLRKYDQGAFWPFHICRLWSCDADDFHWADWLLPTGTSGCSHDGNMEHRNLIFVVRVIRGRRCLAVCLWEETSPRAPMNPPLPGSRTARLLLAWRHNNQLQMCSGSPSASEVVLKVRVPPVVQGKFFREQPELSAASSERRSCWQDVLE